MGRSARGVRGIKLAAGQRVIDLALVKAGHTILTATENGYGKRSLVEDYRLTARGGQGVISIRISERNGKVVDAVRIHDEDELMLISDKGKLVRLHATDVSVIGRATQGVRLINLSQGEHLVAVQRVSDIPILTDE